MSSTWNYELVLDREAVDAIIKRAAGLRSPEWRAVKFYVEHAVESALTGWAQRAMPERVQQDADVLALGLMNVENLRRDPDT